MSQLPPPSPSSLPPEGLTPEDFAPAGVPRQSYGAAQRQQPGSLTNRWAIASLVSGLLGFLPYVPGAIAVITGIIGLRKAADPRYTGRAMATGGTVLGALSLLFWLVLSGPILGLLTAGDQRELTREYIQMLSAGAIEPALERTAPGVDEATLDSLAARMQEWGPAQEVSSYGSSISVAHGVTTAQLEGTATFANGEHPFTITLIKDGKDWKVSALSFN